jgi:Mannosyltransferase (PIG-V)
VNGPTTDDGTVSVGREGGDGGSPVDGNDTPKPPVPSRRDRRRAEASWRRPQAGTVAGLGRTIGAFTLSRLVVAMGLGSVLVVNQGLATHHFTGPWPTPPRASLFLQALGSWDGSWYLLIAGHGYFPPPAQFPIAPGSAFGFFPVWPLLLRGVSDLSGLTPIVVGVVLALVFGAAASVALWHLVCHLCDQSVADRAVVLWVFFPGAVVLSMVYSEGLAILLCAVSLLALLKHRWLVAGCAAGVATGVHPEALVLVACCLWAAVAAVRSDRDWWALVAPVLSLAGVVAYFLYLWNATGDLLAWYHVERDQWGGTGFYHDTVFVVRESVVHPHDLEALVPALGLLFALFGLYLMVRWRPPVIIWIYTVGILLSAFDSNMVGARPRVLLTAFPLIVAVARWVRPAAFGAVAAVSGFLLATMTFLLFSVVLVAP